MMYENFNQLQSCVDLQTAKMHWTLAILNLIFLQSTYGINVGVGISDITGPAAEIGMVSITFLSVNIFITYKRFLKGWQNN